MTSQTNLFLLATAVAFSALPTAGVTSPISDTQSQLHQLDDKISTLQQQLQATQHKRKELTRDLEKTEKEIGNTVRQMAIVQRNIQEKQQEIRMLKQLVATLHHQLTMQRELLSKHIRSRYKMGEYQPLKWLLNQENPYAINRLLTFYQYILKARQNTISQVLDTQTRLNDNKIKLNEEKQQQQLLETQVKQHQAQLNQSKTEQTAIMASLDQSLQNHQQTMSEYKRNKQNLTLLIQQLTQQSLTSRHYPLVPMRHHIPKPIQSSLSRVEPVNQGLNFYAPEGTPVSAVHPGKVVFSDWLKGYGLLLIIDHGAGYMTLYAHNQSLFKQKGDVVKQGEAIASVGHTGGFKQNSLYFEVRHNGKTIPATQWLKG